MTCDDSDREHDCADDYQDEHDEERAWRRELRDRQLTDAVECARVYWPTATRAELLDHARDLIREWADLAVTEENEGRWRAS